MLKTRIFIALQLIIGCFVSTALYAQPTWTLDPFGKEKKPEQYEEKKLASEKTGEKKFTKIRRFTQNTTTHYNYFFNANTKINAVIERAKMSQKEDFSSLLSFYPYSLENTAAQKTELDSVIYKATAGILLHDLRTDWVDNLYLLIGKAYYLRNEMDSAAMTFQFINYNLFPRKKNEDDSRVVGTNNLPGSGGLSIANAEKRNIVNKLLSRPPSRNDALIWLARTFTAQEAYGDAAGLINILRNDPNLPQRLQNDLSEVTAYWFFAQNNYDSAALHLANALSAATTKQDQSRWEFLLAQMNEKTGNYDAASEYYAQAAKHTVDPVMEIFANLNDAKMMRDKGDLKQMDASIANLLRMARKDKYDAYRDIIYYSAAQISLQKPDTANAIAFLGRGLKYSTGNNVYRSNSFLDLANIAYNQQQFKAASSFYDSLQVDELKDSVARIALNERKQSLSKLVQHIDAIETEDSLQRIAAMPEAEREAFVRKILRKLRKEQGLKEEDAAAGTAPITFVNNKQEPVDLFAGTKGEWYFYNNNARGKGYGEFVSKWGKRPNVDNWRRTKAMNATVGKVPGDLGNPDAVGMPEAPVPTAVGELSVASLLQGLPLTTEKMDSSIKTVEINMLALAQVFQNDMQEYQMAINAYDDYLQKFPGAPGEAEAYLGLYYSYSKLGNTAKAAQYKNLLSTRFAATDAGKLVTNPSLLNPNIKSEAATNRYAGIYDMFIEGKFAEAIAAKKAADSTYGSNYWSPQLLYIEAVHNIREKNDSAAIAGLQQLANLYPESALRPKAETMIDVLGRRAQIEDYLSKLEVTREEEERIVVADDKPIVKNAPVAAAPVTNRPVPPTTIQPIKRDSSAAVKPIAALSGFLIRPETQHYVMMLLDKVDYVYVNEAKNAFTRFNKGNYLLQNVEVARDAIDKDRAILLFSKFDDAESAIKYLEKVKKAAPSEVSWLPANKYSFIIVSPENLAELKANKDLEGYKKLLNQSFGNRF
ncbi:MAG: tetratricopeptide repeat protein [Chitinophagaceae bacterium]|nr:MAG: tetratricopeptide repeat protein [Chitinophagaceae bacterium]